MNESERGRLCKNQQLQQLPQVNEAQEALAELRKKVEAGVAGLLARMKGGVTINK